MSNDDEVGYRKPPKHTQFQKGQSGNPKGRPKGRRNFKTDLKATLEEPVRVTEKGKTKTVSTQHAALLRLREKALGGDVRALDRVIELARTYNDEDMAAAAEAALAPSDQTILDGYVERERRRDQTPPTSELSDRRESNEKAEDDDAWLR